VDTSSGYFQSTDFVPTEEANVNKPGTFYVGVDYAISTKEKRDFTAMTVGKLDEEGFLEIVDMRRGRWDGKEILDEMFSLEDTWHPEQWFVESGSIQKALGAALEIEQRSRNVYLMLNPMVPTKDKMSRARSIQSRMRSHAVRFDKRSAWFPDLEAEMTQFPRGKHDDQVDAMAWLGLGLASMVTPASDEEQERTLLKRVREQPLDSFQMGRSANSGY
jgi:predicted phage terminase large subunit-like protein